MGDKWETVFRAIVEPPRALTHQILNLAAVEAESLGNVRKNKHLTGFSANQKTESLGKIRKRSGRQMGDSGPSFCRSNWKKLHVGRVGGAKLDTSTAYCDPVYQNL